MDGEQRNGESSYAVRGHAPPQRTHLCVQVGDDGAAVLAAEVADVAAHEGHEHGPREARAAARGVLRLKRALRLVLQRREQREAG